MAPSLTRGRACNLLLLLGLECAVPLGSESLGTKDHNLLSQFLRLPQPEGPGTRIYIPQEQGGPVIPSVTGFPLRRLLRLAGLWWRYSNPPPHGQASLLSYTSLLKNCNLLFVTDVTVSRWTGHLLTSNNRTL
jgi:hypothetical protein